MGFDSGFVPVMAICDTIPEKSNSFELTRNWEDLRLENVDDFKVHPSAQVLNYATSVFEGTKACYSAREGGYRLFRPRDHFDRFRHSCERIALPSPSYKLYCDALKAIIENAEIIEAPGFLYLRPVCMSRDPQLGASPPNDATFYVIGCIVRRPYFGNSKELKLLARKDKVRAWPGGNGDVKFSGNYAQTNGVLRKANIQGYDQLLWLFRKDHLPVDNRDTLNPSEGSDYLITEAGVSNVFFVVKDEFDKTVIYTPGVNNGLILNGVTRKSVIQIIKDAEFICEEREILMERDFIKWHQSNKLLGAFSTGTATGLLDIGMINYDGQTYEIPLNPLVGVFKQTYLNILYGEDNRYENKWLINPKRMSTGALI